MQVMDFDSLSGSSSLSVNSYQGKDCYHSLNSGKNLLHYEISTSKNDSGCDIHCEDSCDDLSHQSQCSLVDNNNSTNDLFDSELNMKINYHNKIDNLLKSNRQLESELSSANEQIRRLLRYFTSAIGHTSKLDDNCLGLEKKYYEVKLKNSSLQLNLSQIIIDKNEIENKNKILQIDRDNFQIDLSTKTAVIKELKQKISNQFTEIQELLQTSKEKIVLLNQLNCELQQAKNSLEWLKMQLRSHQQDKKSLLNELVNLKSVIISQNENMSLLSIDNKNMKIQFESSQFETSTNRQIECETCGNNLRSNHRSEQIKIIQNNNDEISSVWYEKKINKLRYEISRLKALIVLKDEMFQKMAAENSSAISQFIALQKESQVVNGLKNENFILQTEMSHILNKQKMLNEIYEKTRNELITSKSVLLTNQKEKEDIETFVNVIRNQLSVFELKYYSMNKDIADKTKQILELQQEIQKLYMEKNWQICELDKMRGKEKLISELKNKIEIYIKKIKSLESNLQKNDAEYADLDEEKSKLSSEYLQQIQRYEMVLQQYKDILENLEIKYNNLKKCYAGGNKIVYDLNEVNDNLRIQLDPKISISDLGDKYKESENEITDGKKDEDIYISRNTNENLNSDIERHLGDEENSGNAKDVKKLRILLKVKDLDAKEKQKKYEANTSTLLRKVKEQITEKKLIKKRCAEEFNSLKLFYEDKVEKESIPELQQKTENIPVCSKCLEYEIQLKTLDKNFEELRFDYMNLKQIFEEGKLLIDDFQGENQKFILINSSLKTDDDKRKTENKIISIEANQLKELSILHKKSYCDAAIVEELRKSLEIETVHHSAIMEEKIQLEMKLADLNDKNKFISKGNQILSTSLENKNYELITNEICNNMDGWKTKLDMQSELQSVNSEKFFLQRLNNDLKFALREQVNYNKILKEGIHHQAFISLPTIPTHVQKYDEIYINSIIQENKKLFGKYKFSEIYSGLDSMKEDIIAIQGLLKKNKEY